MNWFFDFGVIVGGNKILIFMYTYFECMCVFVANEKIIILRRTEVYQVEMWFDTVSVCLGESINKLHESWNSINYLVDGSCLIFAYGVSAYWSYPSPLSFELSQCVLCCGRNRLPGNTLPPIRAAECSFPGIALPGCRLDGIRNTFRWTRDVMVDPVDMVIRITKKKEGTNYLSVFIKK